MKILKEYEDKSAGQKVVITLWDNDSVNVEFDGEMLRFENIYEMRSFIEVLDNFIEQEETDEALRE